MLFVSFFVFISLCLILLILAGFTRAGYLPNYLDSSILNPKNSNPILREVMCLIKGKSLDRIHEFSYESDDGWRCYDHSRDIYLYKSIEDK